MGQTDIEEQKRLDHIREHVEASHWSGIPYSEAVFASDARFLLGIIERVTAHRDALQEEVSLLSHEKAETLKALAAQIRHSNRLVQDLFDLSRKHEGELKGLESKLRVILRLPDRTTQPAEDHRASK